MPPTHDVLNQPPALAGYDVADDPVMLDALRREGADWAEEAVWWAASLPAASASARPCRAPLRLVLCGALEQVA